MILHFKSQRIILWGLKILITLMPINLQELIVGQLSTRSNPLVEGAFPAAYLAFGDVSAALVLKMNLLGGMTQKRIQSTNKVKNFEW